MLIDNDDIFAARCLVTKKIFNTHWINLFYIRTDHVQVSSIIVINLLIAVFHLQNICDVYLY